MNGAAMDPPRLREHHDQANLAERIAGQAARDLAERDPLPEIALARIAARIEGDRPRRRSLWLGWAVVTGAFLLGIVTAASAARLDVVPRWLTDLVRATPAPAARSGPAKVRSRATSASATASPSAGRSPGAPSSGNGGGRAPTSRKGTAVAMLASPPAAPVLWSRQLESPPVPSPAIPTALPMPAATGGDWPQPPVAMPPGPSASPTLEQRAAAGTSPTVRPAVPAEAKPAPSSRPQSSAEHLKQVVHALRVERSAGAALALLDRYAGDLAGNAFAEEALLLRVEAMLALDQRGQVLRLLDGMSLNDVAAARALLVTRGELRAAANRCAEGIADFDLVLAEARRPPKQALLGRARCKQKLGDEAGAQVDFDRYRRQLGGASMR